MLRKLWLFFVVFLFLPAPRAAASSAEPAVSSAAELAAWARQHQQAGGSVRLANNIVWDQRGTKLAPLEGGLFSIDLAGHTITVPQNTMLNTARTSFSTSGPQPAFSVEGGLLLLLSLIHI